MSCLESKEQFKELAILLRRKFPTEISQYGDHKYQQLLKDCTDRRILFNLINGVFTFDQFLVRVNCMRDAVTYSCKDDLIRKKGVSLHYFDEEKCKK
jgi:hypothetical protein